MAASMSRSFSQLRSRVLQQNTGSALFTQSRCGIRGQRKNNSRLWTCNDDTVPYQQTELEKKSVKSIEQYPADIEVSSEEFKFVERLLPLKTVPTPQEHAQYPTPSGWLPPNEKLQPAEYAVRRTRNHQLPCYYRKHFDGRETTLVKRVYGDIWKFRDEVEAHFSKKLGAKVDIQVHEVGQWIRLRGNRLEMMAKFLLEKGF